MGILGKIPVIVLVALLLMIGSAGGVLAEASHQPLEEGLSGLPDLPLGAVVQAAEYAQAKDAPYQWRYVSVEDGRGVTLLITPVECVFAASETGCFFVTLVPHD